MSLFPTIGYNNAYASLKDEVQQAESARKKVSLIDDLMDKFKSVANSQSKVFQGMAASIFKICALIGIFMIGVHAALSRASMEDIIKEFILYLLFACLCFIAIKHYDEWTAWLIKLEMKIAGRMNTSIPGVSPGDYNTGGAEQMGLGPVQAAIDFLILILKAISGFGWKEIALALAYFLLGIIIVGLMAMMSARLFVVICESLIAMNLGVILLGLGAWTSTKDYAINHLKYCAATFLKLLSMHFVIYLGLALLSMLHQQLTTDEDDISLGMIAIATVLTLILYIISQSVPQIIAGMINGVNTSSGIGFRAALAGTGMAVATISNVPMATAAAFSSGVQNARGARAVAQSEGKSLGAGRMVGSFFAGAGKSIGGAVTEGVRDKRRASGSFITKTTQSMQDNTSAVGSAQKAARGDTQRMASLHRNYGNTLYQHGRGGNEYANYIAREGGGKSDPYQDNPHAPGGDNSTATGTLKKDQIEKSMAMREKELTANRPKEKNA